MLSFVMLPLDLNKFESSCMAKSVDFFFTKMLCFLNIELWKSLFMFISTVTALNV